jgi:hypothetical protein
MILSTKKFIKFVLLKNVVKKLLILFLLVLCSCSVSHKDYNLTNYSTGEDYTPDDDFMVTSKEDYCGWVAINYDNVNSEKDGDYSYDEVEHQGTFYVLKGEIVTYKRGFSKIFVDYVSLYSTYDYFEEEVLNGEKNYRKVGSSVYENTFETDDVLGTIEEDGTYELGLSPGYLGEDVWIETSMDDDGKSSSISIDIPAFGIGGGDKEDCEDITNKGLEMNAHCKYYTKDGLKGEYQDEVSSYDSSGSDYDQKYMGYKVKWSLSVDNSDLKSKAIEDVSALNSLFTEWVAENGC